MYGAVRDDVAYREAGEEGYTCSGGVLTRGSEDESLLTIGAAVIGGARAGVEGKMTSSSHEGRLCPRWYRQLVESLYWFMLSRAEALWRCADNAMQREEGKEGVERRASGY